MRWMLLRAVPLIFGVYMICQALNAEDRFDSILGFVAGALSLAGYSASMELDG